jgi:oligoendopeptidase F
MTDVPFYNFPYTFGYLFSLGIYVQGQQQGKKFEERYEALLQDTGRLTVEELAQKHLNADLKQLDFWQTDLQSIQKDVLEFIETT